MVSPFKEKKMSEAAFALKEAGISWNSYNQGMHWKFGTIDFWPSTGKWICSKTDVRGLGYKELIAHVRRPVKKEGMRSLTVEQIFEIAKHSKDRSLFGICENIHKEIYK